MEKLIYIYTLSDPDTNFVRYVGKTIQKPKYRFCSHISVSKHKKKSDHTHCWIRGLVLNNKLPIMNVIEETFDINREIYWISEYRKKFELTNHTIGGETGTTGHKWKISEDKLYLYSIKNNKPIYQFSLDGDFIKKWNSSADYCNANNISRSAIKSSINRRGVCNGYVFSFSSVFPGIKTKQIKRIKIIDTINNIEFIFNNAKLASKFLNIDGSYVSKMAKCDKIMLNKYKIKFV